MIKFMRVRRFKTLLDSSFHFESLNILTGLNGMGKSTLMQVFLLVRQSYEKNVLFDKGLLLKGDYASLGSGIDIFSDQESESIEFIISWSEFDDPLHLCFHYDGRSDLQPIDKDNTKFIHNADFPDQVSLFGKKFQYLSADRIGPKTSYDASNYFINDLCSIGNHGEYAAHFIAEKGGKKMVLPALRHADAPSACLQDSLECWMAEICPGLRLRATMQQSTNSVLLRYAFDQGRDRTSDFKPQNVGFGVTYVLPVITAILRAQPGDMLILENPESHLHPAGQSLVGKLCAIAAQNGVQMFIETHSDHFMNGVRVAVKDKRISHDEVKFFFFGRDKDRGEHSSTVASPSIDADGRMDCWPNGFFDEWDRQLERLL